MNIKNNKLQELKDELEQKKKEFDELEQKKKEFLVELTKAFHQTIKEVFDENKHLEKIEWLQYIPYFNDGDTCEFIVYDPEFIYILEGNENFLIEKYKEKYGKNGVAFGWSESGKGNWVKKEQSDSWVLERLKYDVPCNTCMGTQLLSDLVSFIVSEEELMKSIFGSHSKVIITRGGIEVEEYPDHD